MTAAPHGGPATGRLGWGSRPALLVVDVVRAYTEPDGPFALPDPGPAVSACAALVDAAREAGHPVVWTVVRYSRDLAGAGLFVRKAPALAVFAEGAAGGWGEIAPPLSPGPGETLVVTRYASAFLGTSLAPRLVTAGIDTLVVCGVSTSGCVRASATDALSAGLRPMVVRDACTDRSAGLHESHLADLDATCADVVTLDEALVHFCARGPSATAGRTAPSQE
ncbi:isochorismatase family protein [Pseudonocardia sp.]|jgi:maleamate amidohydrolase|uniref:isochorismatase family protein n=1 Tax=Pseudonocardia sp. TaxID=60912 RepID=UPI003D09E99A